VLAHWTVSIGLNAGVQSRLDPCLQRTNERPSSFGDKWHRLFLWTKSLSCLSNSSVTKTVEEHKVLIPDHGMASSFLIHQLTCDDKRIAPLHGVSDASPSVQLILLLYLLVDHMSLCSGDVVSSNECSMPLCQCLMFCVAPSTGGCYGDVLSCDMVMIMIALIVTAAENLAVLG